MQKNAGRTLSVPHQWHWVAPVRVGRGGRNSAPASALHGVKRMHQYRLLIPFAMMDTFQASNASNVPTRDKQSNKRGDL